MSQAARMKRLERIEAQARRHALDPLIRQMAAEMTEELGEYIDPDELLAHAERTAQREREVGWEQTVAELEVEEGFEPGELWAKLDPYRDREGPHE